MDVDRDEWLALSQQNPLNLTEKGRSRLVELENKYGVVNEQQSEGHLDNT